MHESPFPLRPVDESGDHYLLSPQSGPTAGNTLTSGPSQLNVAAVVLQWASRASPLTGSNFRLGISNLELVFLHLFLLGVGEEGASGEAFCSR